MLPKLENCSIAILGLGYVGLPLALEIASRNSCILTGRKLTRKVFGYDIDQNRIKELNKGLDRNKIFPQKILKKVKNIKFVTDKSLLKDIDVFILTVPTPINTKNEPDLTFIKEASKFVGELIKDLKDRLINPIIIYESTVYPGLTEEVCVPIIEKQSNRKYNLKTIKTLFTVVIVQRE